MSPVTRFLTYTSPTVSGSAGSRFVASDEKATVLPSAGRWVKLR